MSTHPVLPLWIDDYDAATSHLSPAEDGIYGRLLRLCWRTPGCSLPNDEAWIARKVRLSAGEWARIGKPVLGEFFKLQRGRLVQKRLKAEYDDISRKKSARVAAGKKGGDAKALKDKDKEPSKATVLPVDTRAFPEPYPDPERTDLFVVPPSPAPPAKPMAAWKADPLFVALWSLATAQMRSRAKSAANAHAAWAKAKRTTTPDLIIAGLKGYLAKDPDVGRTGGPGLHIWLNNRTFETYAGEAGTAAAGADWPDSRWAMAIDLWRADGSWGEQLGPMPGQPGCRVPAHLLIGPKPQPVGRVA